MKKAARWPSGLLLAAALLLPAAVAAEWKVQHSENYSVYTEGDERVAREHAQALEVFRWAALKLLNADANSLRAKQRMRVVLMPGNLALKQQFEGLPEYTAGLYAFCADGAVAYVVEAGRSGGNSISPGQLVMQHEVAHHLMFQYARVSYPDWYVEGFAEYMSMTRQDGTDLLLGDRNIWRAPELERGAGLPYAELLSWHLKPRQERSNSDLSAFYAQSWLLTHFMFDDSARAAALERYVARVAEGAEPVAAFESTTGLALAELPRLLDTHLRKLRKVVIHGAELPKAQVQLQTLDADASAVLLDQLRLQTCPSPARVQEILARLRSRAALPASGPATRQTLAHAELLAGNLDTAAALLQPLLGASAAAPMTHMLMGFVESRRAAKLEGEDKAAAQERARGQFFQAYRLEPAHAPTLYQLGRAMEDTRGPTHPNTLNAARGARALAPAVADVALFAARIEILAGQPERAAQALAPLASNPHAPAFAAHMRRAMAEIRAGGGVAALNAAVEAASKPEPKPAQPAPDKP